MIKYSLIERKNPITKECSYYSNLAPVKPITLEDLKPEIAETCRVAPFLLWGIINCLEREIIEALQNGHSVRLGDLGSFHLTLQSKGAKTKEEFTDELLEDSKVRFIPSPNMRKSLSLKNPKVELVTEMKEE